MQSVRCTVALWPYVNCAWHYMLALTVDIDLMNQVVVVFKEMKKLPRITLWY